MLDGSLLVCKTYFGRLTSVHFEVGKVRKLFFSKAFLGDDDDDDDKAVPDNLKLQRLKLCTDILDALVMCLVNTKNQVDDAQFDSKQRFEACLISH